MVGLPDGDKSLRIRKTV